MKTHTIKTDNAELMIVELPKVCDYKLTKEMIFIMDKERSTIHRFKGSYTLLGNPDEISEEDARELVKAFEFGTEKYPHLRFFIHKTNYSDWFTAKESLLSLLESEIYWENPYESKADSLASNNSANGCALYRKAFHEFCEAEEKTFDRNRSLIFKKNN